MSGFDLPRASSLSGASSIGSLPRTFTEETAGAGSPGGGQGSNFRQTESNMSGFDLPRASSLSGASSIGSLPRTFTEETAGAGSPGGGQGSNFRQTESNPRPPATGIGGAIERFLNRLLDRLAKALATAMRVPVAPAYTNGVVSPEKKKPEVASSPATTQLGSTKTIEASAEKKKPEGASSPEKTQQDLINELDKFIEEASDETDEFTRWLCGEHGEKSQTANSDPVDDLDDLLAELDAGGSADNRADLESEPLVDLNQLNWNDSTEYTPDPARPSGSPSAAPALSGTVLHRPDDARIDQLKQEIGALKDYAKGDELLEDYFKKGEFADFFDVKFLENIKEKLENKKEEIIANINSMKDCKNGSVELGNYFENANILNNTLRPSEILALHDKLLENKNNDVKLLAEILDSFVDNTVGAHALPDMNNGGETADEILASLWADTNLPGDGGPADGSAASGDDTLSEERLASLDETLKDIGQDTFSNRRCACDIRRRSGPGEHGRLGSLFPV